MGVLRFVLATCVVVGHARGFLGFTYFSGPQAVEIFFILSGFYISLVLNEKYCRKENGHRIFYVNRYLRLFPSYAVVVVSTVLTAAVLGVMPYSHSPATEVVAKFSQLNLLERLYVVFTNLFIFGQDFVLFLGIDSQNSLFLTSDFRASEFPVWRFLAVPQAWSLGIELLFYMIAPLLVTRKFRYVLLLALSSLWLRFTLYRGGLDFDPWTFRFFPNELVFFALGTFSYGIYAKMKGCRRISQLKAAGILMVTLTTATILLFNYLPVREGLKATALYAWVCAAVPLMFVATRANAADRFLGELSYPMYISHVLVLMWFRNFGFVKGVYVFTFTVLISTLMVLFIERPIDRLRQARVRNAESPPDGETCNFPS